MQRDERNYITEMFAGNVSLQHVHMDQLSKYNVAGDPASELATGAAFFNVHAC